MPLGEGNTNMIGYLKGEIALRSAEVVILDVQGVGYELRCPLTTIERLPNEGEPCSVFVKTHVREDQITLFGFSSLKQRKLFEYLTSVSGVGPRLALACLSGMDEDELVRAVIQGEAKRLSTVPGIGKRTAERIILDLRPKFEKSYALSESSPDTNPILEDLKSALMNLNYPQKQVDEYIGEVTSQAASMSFDELLRGAITRFAF